MSAISIIIISGLGLFILSMAAVPFAMKNSGPQEQADDPQWEQQRELLFSQLSDLEYDYHMDKISEEDYQQSKRELTAEAAQYIDSGKQDLERIESEVDQEIARVLKQQDGIKQAGTGRREVHS